jgi:hypothetical protein
MTPFAPPAHANTLVPALSVVIEVQLKIEVLKIVTEDQTAPILG